MNISQQLPGSATKGKVLRGENYLFLRVRNDATYQYPREENFTTAVEKY